MLDQSLRQHIKGVLVHKIGMSAVFTHARHSFFFTYHVLTRRKDKTRRPENSETLT